MAEGRLPCSVQASVGLSHGGLPSMSPLERGRSGRAWEMWNLQMHKDQAVDGFGGLPHWEMVIAH